MGDDVPEAIDRAPVRRILSERNMRTPPIDGIGYRTSEPRRERSQAALSLRYIPFEDHRGFNKPFGSYNPNACLYGIESEIAKYCLGQST
jgi:hypothetical protein